MNLMLFTSEETSRPLPANDLRARHMVQVLRAQPGQTFDVGLVDGPRGKARIEAMDAHGITLAFTWGAPPPPLPPIQLLLGLPRPQTARKVLQEATSLGVQRIDFLVTERGEAGYAQSTLWTSGEWRRHLCAGAEQAFCTRLPVVNWTQTLAATLASLPAGGTRLALDNYEAEGALGEWCRARTGRINTPVLLALGAERGWSAAERSLLRQHDFHLWHLGERVLRVETAVVAALALVHARLEGEGTSCEIGRAD